MASPADSSSTSSSASPSSLLDDARAALPSFSDPTTEPRLRRSIGELMLWGSGAAGLGGFVTGYSSGARMAGLRFRAEHAHRMPRNTRELYFYHRRKNYYVALHGLKRGFGQAGRLAFWTGLFFFAEASVDNLRAGRKDFVSSTTAGLGVASLFSLANRFTLVEAARSAKTGFVAGLTYGLLQDALAMARGRRFRYVDFFLRRADDDNG